MLPKKKQGKERKANKGVKRSKILENGLSEQMKEGVLMSPHPLSNFEIQNYCQNKPKFHIPFNIPKSEQLCSNVVDQR